MHSHILQPLQGCFTTFVCSRRVSPRIACAHTIVVCNEQHYLQPSIASLVDVSGSIQSKNALPGTSESFERAQVEHPDTEVATACFMIDCVETTKLGICGTFMHSRQSCIAVYNPRTHCTTSKSGHCFTRKYFPENALV